MDSSEPLRLQTQGQVGMHLRQQLAKDSHRLGVAAKDVVMVHASVRAVGEVAGGPDQVHLAVKDVLTAEGTLMMYASCPRYYDEMGRGNLTKEQEAQIVEKLPAFDPLIARSARDNGALVELLRTYPGSRVNDHVARFVVWGKQADYLISDQLWNYAFWVEFAARSVSRPQWQNSFARVGSRYRYFPALRGVYFQNEYKVCGWLRTLFQDPSPKAQALRQRAMPRIAEDLSRVPDHLFSGRACLRMIRYARAFLASANRAVLSGPGMASRVRFLRTEKLNALVDQVDKFAGRDERLAPFLIRASARLGSYNLV
jgi:hypothetical protein